MKRILSIGFLIVGIILIAYGLNSADSISSSFSRFFTGSPTDESIWFLIGGVVALAIGLGTLLPWSSKSG